jgi:hypothetical protein
VITKSKETKPERENTQEIIDGVGITEDITYI